MNDSWKWCPEAMAIRSEYDVLRLIDRHFPGTGTSVLLGRGDDCAVLDARGELCVSMDFFLENRHFRRSYFSPRDIGYKALAVNVSDIAAMGAKPLGFALGLAAPVRLPEADWDGIFAGMAELARPLNLALAGGDLSTADALTLCVTVWGQKIGPDFLRRGKADPEDVIFVHGPLGLARLGLTLLEASGPRAVEEHPILAAAHLRPLPRTEAGLCLARSGLVKSLMDVSDGLAADLPRLLGRGVARGAVPEEAAQGAHIELGPEILDPALIRGAGALGLDPVREAFLGGEDYALLGAVAPENWDHLTALCPGLTKIGRATARPGIELNGRPVSEDGFDHFTRS